MKRKIQLTLVLLSSLCLCSACTYDPFSFFNPPSEPTLKTEIQETQAIKECTCEKDKNVTSTTPETLEKTAPETDSPFFPGTVHPLGGELLKKHLEDIETLTVDEFDRLTQENGTDYWKGKNILIQGKLESKPNPEIILHKNVAGERFDIPSSSISASDEHSTLYIDFFLSRETNNYIIEKLKLGDPISVEFLDIQSVKTYEDGYLINVKDSEGPNLLY